MSDQGLHCLLGGISVTNRTKMKKKKKKKTNTPNTPLNANGLIQWESPLGLFGLSVFIYSSVVFEAYTPLASAIAYKQGLNKHELFEGNPIYFVHVPPFSQGIKLL